MSRRKLLLADDSITIQKVVNLTFADEGIEVIAVGDGNSALDRMQETPPDLVMADVNMPGLNGYDLCERIKQNERLSHIPVILLVGSFEPFDETEAARVGADDYLTKPFQSIRQLVNKVTGMLETTENRRTASTARVPVADFAGSQGAASAEHAGSDATAETAPVYDIGAADDETIQTGSISTFPLDESQKFESRTFDADDAGKTQPLSARDLKDFAFVEETAREYRSDDSPIETFDTSEATSIQSEPTDVSEQVSAAPRPAPPVFDFDDFNILEIPFDEEDEPAAEDIDRESSSAASSASSAEISSAGADESAASFADDRSGDSATDQSLPGDSYEAEFVEEIREAEEGKTIAESETESEIAKDSVPPPAPTVASDFSFPPEVIEAIAQKVAEKLAASTASDVAPRVADLIIQKMAEEKHRQ